MVTAAHVVEPILSGARDSYIDLGRYYDSARLEKRKSELTELTARYKAAYKDAYKFLAAADTLRPISSAASNGVLNEAVNNCLSLLPSSVDKHAVTRHCFIDTVCSKGHLSLLSNFEDWHIYNITASNVDGDIILRRMNNILDENGYGIFTAYSPLNPTLARHLLIPCHRTIFTLEQTDDCPCAAAVSYRKISDKINTSHDKLLKCAEETLAAAKRAHDTLEEVYNPCVDFSGIHREACKHISAIL